MTHNDSDLPFFERPDLSPFLVHLTKNTTSLDGYSALDNLVSILQMGQIHGSTTESGYIKGPHPAACFMDVPLGALKYVLNASNTDPERPRYEPYGVLVTKRFAYAKRNCRPVLYLSEAERAALTIPVDEQWRIVRLDAVDGTGVNWYHEREWRCKGDYRLPARMDAVLVQSAKEAAQLRERISDEPKAFKCKPRVILPLDVVCQGLPYMA